MKRTKSIAAVFLILAWLILPSISNDLTFLIMVTFFYLIPGVFFYSLLENEKQDVFQFLCFSLGFGIVFHVILNVPVFIFHLNTKISAALSVLCLALMFLYTDFRKIKIEKIEKRHLIFIFIVGIVSVLFYRIGAIQTGEDTIYYTMVRKLVMLDSVYPWDMSYYPDENHNIKLATGIAPWFSAIATFSKISSLDPYFVLKKYVWIIFIFGSLTFYCFVYCVTQARGGAFIGILVYLLAPVFRILSEHPTSFGWVTESIRPQLFNSYYFMGFIVLCFLTHMKSEHRDLKKIILMNTLIVCLVLLNVSHIVPLSLLLLFFVIIRAMSIEGGRKKAVYVTLSLSILIAPVIYVLALNHSVKAWKYDIGILFLTEVQDMHYFDTTKLAYGKTLAEVMDDKAKYNLENFTRISLVHSKRVIEKNGNYYVDLNLIGNVSFAFLLLLILPAGNKYLGLKMELYLLIYIYLFIVFIIWCIPLITKFMLTHYCHKTIRLGEFWMYLSQVFFTVLIYNFLSNPRLLSFILVMCFSFLSVHDLLGTYANSNMLIYVMFGLLSWNIIVLLFRHVLKKPDCYLTANCGQL